MSGEACRACGRPLATRNFVDYRCECGRTYQRRGGELVAGDRDLVKAVEEEPRGRACCAANVRSEDGFRFRCTVCDGVYWRRGGELVPIGESEAIPGDDPIPRAIVVDQDKS